MSITLPPLPYDKNALAPYISASTLDLHHGKHHQTYVDNLIKLSVGTAYENLSLEEIIQKSAKDSDAVGIFNNAAQIWNHTFYWNSLKQGGGGQPAAPLLERLNTDFGGYTHFKELFKKTALAQFGSGWTWLVEEHGRLKIVKTSNADLPMIHGQKALLTCDVWEHAYYVDYQNRRADYVDIFLDHLINWAWAEEKLASGNARYKL